MRKKHDLTLELGVWGSIVRMSTYTYACSVLLKRLENSLKKLNVCCFLSIGLDKLSIPKK